MTFTEFKTWFNVFKSYNNSSDLNLILNIIDEKLNTVEEPVVHLELIQPHSWIQRPYLISCDGNAVEQTDGLNVTSSINSINNIGCDWRSDTSEPTS